MAKRIVKAEENSDRRSSERSDTPNDRKATFRSRFNNLSRQKVMTWLIPAGLLLLMTMGAMAQMGLLPHIDKQSGQKYGWFGTEPAVHTTSLWNPFAAAPAATSQNLQLSKEYVYAGDRLLAIEETGSGSATPSPTVSPTPTLTPNPCNSNFNDDFNDSLMNASIWSPYQFSNNPSPVYERNGMLEIVGITHPTDNTYAGYITNCSYPIIGTTITSELVQGVTYNGSGGTVHWFGYDNANFGTGVRFAIYAFDYSINFYDQTFIYDPVQHRWLRIRDDTATQTVYFESSPDGTNWTVRASFYRGSSYDSYSEKLIQMAGTTGGQTGTDTVKVDNLSYTNSNN